MQKFLENRVANIALFVLTIIANALANAVPLNGQTTGEISAKYPSLFTPAGFTFSIWGLIYLALTAFLIYQILPSQRDNPLIDKIGPYFKASCLANAAWIFAWHYDALFVSLFLMLCILLSLVGLYQTLYLWSKSPTRTEAIFLYVPFSLYTGWITVATIANISAIQIDMGWDNLGLAVITWTLVKLAIAGGIAATIILRRGDIVFGLVVAWAAYGISAKQVATPEVAGAALTLTFLALLLIAAELWRTRLYLK